MEWPQAEFLLPQIKKHITPDEFPFLQDRRENPEWTEERLRATVQRLGHWEYYFPFSHGLTTEINATFDQGTIAFHRFRSKLISETVVEVLGPDLGGSTVLDLACHCGVFSLDLAARGAKAAHGVEFREKNLNQARFLADYYRVGNASFEQGDVYALDPGRRADVILCLGILYHVVRPVDLVEFCFRNCDRFAVIDTVCHKEPISAYKVVGGKNTESAIEGTRSIEMQPTYRAVVDTMREVGFADVIEVVGTCDQPIELYSDFSRRCFIGFKPGGRPRHVVTSAP